MIAEATSQHREPSFALSPGIHRRQAWRPAGLRGVQSILSGIASRTRPFDGYRARLTAWYEQFVQRSQPFIGWRPLTTPQVEAHDTQSSFGSPQGDEGISRRDPPVISKELPPSTRPVSVTEDQASPGHLRRFPVEQRPQEPFVSPRSISVPIRTPEKSMPPSKRLAGDLSNSPERPIEATAQPVAPPASEEIAENPAVPTRSNEERRLPPRDERLATVDRGKVSSLPASPHRNEEHPLERPALRLAILRPINTVAGTVQRKESASLSSGTNTFSSGETKDLSGPENWLVAARPAVLPRLASEGWSLQRPEAHDGFPVGMKSEVGRAADISSEVLGAVSVRDASAFRNVGVPETASLESSRQAETSESPAGPPMVLPELQIRLLRPDQSASTNPPLGKNVAEGKRSTIEMSKPQPPAPAAPPPLDINAVADKVYQALQRRHQLERERRGLY